MDFAMIENSGEYDLVVKKLFDLKVTDWVNVDGITDIVGAANKVDWYFASTGEKINFEMIWASGQPDGGSNEKCLNLISPDPYHKFNNIPCNNQYAFICQTSTPLE